MESLGRNGRALIVCFQTAILARVSTVTNATIKAQTYFFLFSAYGPKIKPPAMRVVIDIKESFISEIYRTQPSSPAEE